MNKVTLTAIILIALLCLTGLIKVGYNGHQKVQAASYAEQGYTFYKLQQFSAAIASFSKSLTLNPRQPKVMGNLGLCELSINNDNAAIQDLSLALAMKIDGNENSITLRRDLYFVRGMCYFKQHQDRKACADLQNSVSLSQHATEELGSIFNETAAYNSLAWMMATSPDASLHDGEQAASYAQKALNAIKTTDPPEHLAAINDTIAACEARSGHYALAASKQTEAINILLTVRKDTELKQMQQRFHLYQQGKPYTDSYAVIK